MDDPKSVLLEQIAYWRDKIQEARATLRYGEEVLPGLEQSLSRLEAVSFPSRGLLPPDQVKVDDSTGNPPEPGSLTGADEITRGIESVLPVLPQLFTGTDVAAALDKSVNRSSLRSMLQAMAGVGNSFVVETLGKGRRATIYRKL